ncbi:hypothetical protein SO694_00022257 [Aureococcus anophagefferens]|uniref:EF-hand domain-containing protein n=1 Tax=Aureococcus anophagefferens TaxID=44056 RepID=A0ABR1FTH8_AURAN
MDLTRLIVPVETDPAGAATALGASGSSTAAVATRTDVRSFGAPASFGASRGRGKLRADARGEREREQDCTSHRCCRAARRQATAAAPRRRRRRTASNTMTTPGEYGGVSTVDTSAVAASIGAQVSQQAQELKRSVVNGSVELSTLGSIGAVLSVVVSCLNVLGNIVKLSPTRAVLMVYCFGGGLALLALEGMHNAPPFAPPSALALLRRWKLKLRTEAHVLTTLTGRSLGYASSSARCSSRTAARGSARSSGSTASSSAAPCSTSRGPPWRSCATCCRARRRRSSSPSSTRKTRADRDGKLAGSELGALCAACGAALAPREVESALRILDTDGSGLVDREEFRRLVQGRQPAAPRGEPRLSCSV